jgi:hypothetical protein
MFRPLTRNNPHLSFYFIQSGPSFAKESELTSSYLDLIDILNMILSNHPVIKRQPTTVSVSSLSLSHAQRTSDIFHQPWFRCYTGADPVGVELAGALKNIYAIASGIADGLGYENNTRAGIYTTFLMS